MLIEIFAFLVLGALFASLARSTKSPLILHNAESETFSIDSMIDPLKYLPPGWTEDDWKNRAEVGASQNLSEEVQRNVLARMRAERVEKSELKRVQRLRGVEQRIAASERMPVKHVGPIDYGKEMPALVDILDLEHEDRWGFMVFITTYGRKIDASTDSWVDDIRPTTTSRLNKYGPHSRIDELKANEVYILVKEKKLQHASIERVLAEWEDLDQVQNIVPNEMNHGYVLILDATSLNSFREPQPNVPPFILAVDLGYRAKNYVNQTYEGNFKVALTALPEFYAAIKNLRYTRLRIWEMANSSGVWEHIR